jgi:hypothetical protein
VTGTTCEAYCHGRFLAWRVTWAQEKVDVALVAMLCAASVFKELLGFLADLLLAPGVEALDLYSAVNYATRLPLVVQAQAVVRGFVARLRAARLRAARLVGSSFVEKASETDDSSPTSVVLYL